MLENINDGTKNIVIILQAVVVLVTVTFSFLGIIVANARAKNEGMKFISGYRQDFRIRLLNASASIGEDIYNLENTLNKKQKNEVLNKLAIDINKLSYILNGLYDPDRIIIKLIWIMLEQAENYVKTGVGLAELRKSYNYLYKEVCFYSIAEWTRMKEQAKGINVELKGWSVLYYKERDYYEKLNYLHTWIELKNYIVLLNPKEYPLKTTLDKQEKILPVYRKIKFV